MRSVIAIRSAGTRCTSPKIAGDARPRMKVFGSARARPRVAVSSRQRTVRAHSAARRLGGRVLGHLPPAHQQHHRGVLHGPENRAFLVTVQHGSCSVHCLSSSDVISSIR